MHLEPNFNESKLAAKEYVQSLSSLSKTLSLFESKLQVLQDFESPESWEQRVWGCLKIAIQSCAYFYERISLLANVHLFEQISFFSGCLERIKGSQNTAKVIAFSDNYSSKDKLDLTKELSQEWDAFRTIKSRLGLRHLLNFITAMQKEVNIFLLGFSTL